MDIRPKYALRQNAPRHLNSATPSAWHTFHSPVQLEHLYLSFTAYLWVTSCVKPSQSLGTCPELLQPPCTPLTERSRPELGGVLSLPTSPYSPWCAHSKDPNFSWGP